MTVKNKLKTILKNKVLEAVINSSALINNDFLKIYAVIDHRLNVVANMINNAYKNVNVPSPDIAFSHFIVEDGILFAMFKFCYDATFNVRMTFESYDYNCYFVSILNQDNNLDVNAVIRVLLRKTKRSDIKLYVGDMHPFIISEKFLNGHDIILHKYETLESLAIEHDMETGIANDR